MPALRDNGRAEPQNGCGRFERLGRPGLFTRPWSRAHRARSARDRSLRSTCHAIGQVLEGVGETPGSGASDAAFACSRARRPDHGSSSRTPTPKSRGSSACFPRSRRSGRNGRARPRHRRPCGSARSAVHQGCALRVTADIGTSPEMKMSAENSACSQKCSLLRSQFFCGSG
jgi:hypothetical protein